MLYSDALTHRMVNEAAHMTKAMAHLGLGTLQQGLHKSECSTLHTCRLNDFDA